jgi:hypothetical protein
MFSLVMLAGTPHGDAYTFNELREMFEAAGFSRNEHIPLTPMPQPLNRLNEVVKTFKF